MFGDGLRTCVPAKSIVASQEVTIRITNLPGPRRLLSGFTNLWSKYVLKWVLGKRNLHKKSEAYFVSENFHITLFTDILAGFTFNSEFPGRNVVFNKTIAGRRRTLLLYVSLVFPCISILCKRGINRPVISHSATPE